MQMKRLSLIIISTLTFLTASAQQGVLHLQPDTSNGNHSSYISDDGSVCNNCWIIGAGLGTVSAVPVLSRSYFQFNLSLLPNGAAIDSAFLNLFHEPTVLQNTQGGSNDVMLTRVSTAWNMASINFLNQPAWSADSINLGPSFTPTDDKVHIDVKNSVQFWSLNPSLNFGWSVYARTEIGPIYRFQHWAGFSNSDTTRHPSLDIYYTLTAGTNSISKIKYELRNLGESIVIDGADEIIEVAVMNVCGQQALQQIINSSDKINISIIGLPVGLYVAQIKEKNGAMQSLKFIKQ